MADRMKGVALMIHAEVAYPISLSIRGSLHRLWNQCRAPQDSDAIRVHQGECGHNQPAIVVESKPIVRGLDVRFISCWFQLHTEARLHADS